MRTPVKCNDCTQTAKLNENMLICCADGQLETLKELHEKLTKMEAIKELQEKIASLETELKKQKEVAEKGAKLLKLMRGENFSDDTLF